MTADDPAVTAAGASAALQRLIHGYQFTQALYVAARLEIPDLLADGPKPAAELAMHSGAHPPSLARLLRALTTLCAFAEVEPDVFGPASPARNGHGCWRPAPTSTRDGATCSIPSAPARRRPSTSTA